MVQLWENYASFKFVPDFGTTYRQKVCLLYLNSKIVNANACIPVYCQQESRSNLRFYKPLIMNSQLKAMADRFDRIECAC